MKKGLILSCLLAFTAFSVNAQDYFVNATSGNDNNSGTTPAAAWKSLKKVNSVKFTAGDNIMFATNDTFEGQLKPQGKGTQKAPITFSSYGVGKKPHLAANGNFLQTVYLYNTEYVTVKGFEITNKGAKRIPKTMGVYLHLNKFGSARGIKILDNDIHDIYGSPVKAIGGGCGIFWHTEGTKPMSRFDGLIIENNTLKTVDRDGIRGWGDCYSGAKLKSECDYCHRATRYPSINMVIRKNTLEDIGGDGIVIKNADGTIVEYNKIKGGRLRSPKYSAGIWPHASDNTLIQYNEVSGYVGTKDGQGFDSDWNCVGTIFQYNYSHNNEGGFMLLCNNSKHVMPFNIGNKKTIIRYNISINDSTRTFHASGKVDDVEIYNNVIIVNNKKKVHALKTDYWEGGIPNNFVFRNNIFLTNGEFVWEEGKGTYKFANNNYFGKHHNLPNDANAIFSNPLFVDPSASSEPEGFENLTNFMIQADSPLVGKGCGKDLKLVKDFFGNNYKGDKINIGFDQGKK
ncbi:right-handed parallel beta-helix repeat-containing protein [Lentisphaerota bacterium WC36G]|nr:right-handed parallel beta-helix repeat-containing protein [Lentisphaerae bacterium WC36]